MNRSSPHFRSNGRFRRRQTRHAPATALLLTTLVSLLILVPSNVASASVEAGTTAKPTCHRVVKKVHGKKKTVKVCTPAPSMQDNARLAQSLATAITSASTPSAGTKALQSVMAALHVPVISASGAVIVPGYLTSPQHLLLYSFELRAIDGALQRKDQIGLAGVSALLATAGVKGSSGAPVDADTIRQILVSGVQDAQSHPSDAQSLVPLLVRDLGLGHSQPYDLAANPSTDSVQLDALQQLLVVIDLTYPELQQSTTTSAVARASFGRLLRTHALPAEDSCTSQLAQLTGGTLPFGKWGVALLPKIGAIAGATTGVLDMIHGMMLAYSVKVSTTSPELQTTHEGPAGHAADAGKVLRFSVKVEMQDDYGDTAVNCGTMAGFTLPKPGPISGVPILWEQAVNDISPYGSLSYDPQDHKTGSDGIASLVFTPRDEAYPGFGTEKDARGTINGMALYQSALGNIAGSAVQYLTPKYAGMAWEVTYHQPRGFTFSNAQGGWHGSGSSEQFTVNGRICGSSPYGAWSLNGQVVAQGAANFSTPVALTVTIPQSGSAPMGSAGYPATMQFVAQPSPHMIITLSTEAKFGASLVPDQSSITVPVQEDLTCPQN
jgi:hypothetical protein